MGRFLVQKRSPSYKLSTKRAQQTSLKRSPTRNTNSEKLADQKESLFWIFFERSIALMTLASISFGVFVYYEEHKDRRETATTNAWSLITTPAPGNSGKRDALQYLVNSGVSVRGIDISCEAMKGNWNENRMTCQRPTFLEGLQFTPPNFAYVDFFGANMDGANLSNSDLNFASLERATFRGAYFRNADLSRAALYKTNFERANLKNVSFQGSYAIGTSFVRANLTGSNFQDANISGADFSESSGIEDSNFSGAWFWDDLPPIGLNKNTLIQSCKWEPGRKRLVRPDDCEV
jgi:Pentapeptide repeats (8 copies)